MPVPRPTKPFHAIELTASLSSGDIIGEPGNIIEIDETNREAAIALYMERGCRLLLTPEAPEPPRPSGDVDEKTDHDDADNENGEGLADIDDAEAVDELPIPPRYISALKDAGIKTLAEAKAHSDLSSIPGISKNIANKIAQL
jgi:hypothetical protein